MVKTIFCYLVPNLSYKGGVTVSAQRGPTIPDALSLLNTTWPSLMHGDGCDGDSHVSQKHSISTAFIYLSHSISCIFATTDLTFNNENVI